ncbi:virulence factor SrfB [Rhodovulum sulfidophilum]|uniref:virulence factor SrfB n=1 Tax=Rhodovulum sulfidophilum TaxID=35806 RepID=UPI0009525B1A|nr:virulence factor SrfB [Rhodovulum sulfidophilum]MBL3550732.1 virulence factor SrfB [Rhodovulum sulfidophilum]OLS48835.1 virulence factor SrfB [Rhodovulum sulfidophilum]
MISDRKEQLRPLVNWHEDITLVPFSGIQMLDFGFAIDQAAQRPWRFIERTLDDTPDERMLIPLTGNEELDAPLESAAKPDDDPYSIRPAAALEPFLSKWVPVPILRMKSERGPAGEERFDPGPSTWARMRVVELAAPDPETGHTHRVQIALDTALTAQDQSAHYVAPQIADAENPRDFRFVSDPAQMDWFLRRIEEGEDGQKRDPQLWVSDWLKELFLGFKRAERPGRNISEDTLPHQFEHWARYLACLQFIDRAVKIPKIRFVNTVSERDAVTPVDVDLVLDVGNSRTCGILIERFPGEARVDLVRSFPLEIRDLSRPELYYSGLFESRVEFADLKFGDDRFASRSGRRNAFMWPGFVRVGPEALRLIQREEGTETMSGLSSPKRYLWDDETRQQDWRFHNHFDPNNLPKSVRAAMRQLNEAGDVIEQVRHEEKQRLRRRGRTPSDRAIRPRFSRSSLFGFMLAEIFSHALVQINDPASRARRAQSDLPRRLNRIILTLPTATSVQEQAIMRSRAEGALKMVWAMLGMDEALDRYKIKPAVTVEWDEASCTQLVYLYSEITQKFDGNIEAFLRLKGRDRVRPGETAPSPSLRLACIDIGGGTTDLMISTYWSEANRVLHPVQTFREGFRVAGDDMLQRVVSSIVLPRLQSSIEAAGGRYVGEKLRELFAGDIGGQDQQVVQKRRQFALRALMPLAVAILSHSETAAEYDRFDLSVAETLGLPRPGPAPDEDGVAPPRAGPAEPLISDEILAYIEQAARDVGAPDWRFADVVLTTSREDVDAIAREAFQKVLGNMAEVIDHLGVDVVLLTGRPSRLPAVRSIVEELLVVPPYRLISMHSYKTGRWYPFRDPITQRIGDPKSTVAVGGMLIALSENRIPNFKVTTGAFQMKSTARFVGEMDNNGQILDARLMFSDLDLDTKGGAQEATVDMFSPVHIGSRQLPIERWTTTPLFRLDFANPNAQRRPTPIRVTFEKADYDDDDREDSEAKLRREALREAFEITLVEDGAGDGMKNTDVVLKLHTLGFDDEYWIDTGVFRY